MAATVESSPEMKRLVTFALIVCALVSFLVIGMYFRGWLDAPQRFAWNWLPAKIPVRTYVPEKFQFVFVVLLSFGVALATLATRRHKQLVWIVGALLVELLAATWLASLYHVFFQPTLPFIAAALGFGFAFPIIGFANATPSAEPREPRVKPVKAPKPAKAVKERVVRPKVSAAATRRARDLAAKSYEVTSVVCDLADKHDLAEECDPDVYARITEKFLAHATETFVKAGAFIESAAGEGIVAIFGYPNEDPLHAEQATREAMGLVESFTDLPEDANLSGVKIGVHAGVSSGRVIASSLGTDGSTLLVGEPVELARRFCIANRFYGSRVLIGPRTFELASRTLVARPIDFLGGVDVRERHEIYEPISLAVDASPEEIERRDEFWNGVVLYREKRWAEAYAHFQKARRPDQEVDAPLALYLRRLEPLALQLTNTPLDE